MGIGSSGVANYANTRLALAIRTIALGNMGDFEVVSDDGVGLGLNFQTMTALDPRITFSRASNATVVGSDNLVQYAPHNLLTYSEQFDNAAWTKIAATVTANASLSPGGTVTADKLIEDATSSNHRAILAAPIVITTGTSYTNSVYVKAGERNWFRLWGVDVNTYINVDLTEGTIGLVTASVGNYGCESAGNGWYRVWITTPSAIGTNGYSHLQIMQGNATGAIYTGDGVSGIYTWGAQLNQGALQPYNSTSVKNLLGYSENFENAAWTKSNSSIDATPVMGPLGFVGAEKLVEDTATSPHSIQQTAITAETSIVTASLYCKAGEKQYVQLRVSDTSPTSGSRAYATFDLLNGTYNVGSITATNVTANIIQLGSGWYRCTLTCGLVITGTTTLSHIYITNNANASSTPPTYTGDGISGIYIFGAQLSDSASLDPYSYNFGAAPTSTAYYGPRFDYDPVTLAPKGLLIEEQRTNLLTYSEQFDNAAWILNAVTIGINQAQAPSGLSVADKLIESATLANHYISQGVTIPDNTVYTTSIYAKKAERTELRIQVRKKDGGFVSQYFNLSTGALGSSANSPISPFITNVGGGWYRCGFSVDSLTGAAAFATFFYTSVSGNTNYTGDGTSGLYLWGAQLEAGASPTSYIPTTSAAVTRAADNASMVGTNFSSWYNQSEGTIYSQWMLGGDITSNSVYNINDGTGNNLIRARYNSAGSASDNAVIVGGSTQAVLSASNQITLYTSYKNAMAYKQDDFARSSSGLLVTDNLGNIPTVTQMNIGCGAANVEQLNGHIQSINYYPRRLANSALQAITS